MGKKRRKRLVDSDGEGLVDIFTLPELAQTRVLVVSYNPILDSIEIDGQGMTPLEVRALLSSAADEFCGADQE